MKRNLLILCMLLLSTGLIAQKTPKVLVVGWDGVLVDAIKQLRTSGEIPVLDSLMDNGLYSTDSWNVGKTISGPTWSSIMNGVWQDKHNITDNSYTNANFAQYPYFTKRVKECNPDLYAVQIITWNPMGVAGVNAGGYITNADFNESIDVGDYGQGLVTAQAVVELQNPDLDILFLHYDEPDAQGHSGGFSTDNNQYMAAIKSDDQQLGQVLNAIKSRPTYQNEDWLIIVMTDHGGIFTSHGGCTDSERNVWIVFQGAHIPVNVEVTGSDPGTLEFWCFNAINWNMVKLIPVETDIAVSAIDHLTRNTTCEISEKILEWDLSGQSWLEPSTYVQNHQDKNFDFQIFPNPNHGVFVATLDVPFADECCISINDATGKLAYSGQMKLGSDLKLRAYIDIKDLHPGTYIMSVNTGNQVFSRILIKQ